MDTLNRRTFLAGTALDARGRRAAILRRRQVVDMAAAKKEGKMVWYCSVPVATAQKVANMFEQADRHQGRAVPLRRLQHPAPLPAGGR